MNTNNTTNFPSWDEAIAKMSETWAEINSRDPAEYDQEEKEVKALTEAQLDEYYRITPVVVNEVDMSSPLRRYADLMRQHSIPSPKHKECLARAKQVAA